MGKPTTGHSAKSFRPDIEGLRGLAVLLVVLYHARLPYVNGGYVGVDVFFVISGYLITGLLMKEVATTGRISFLQFYARRGRRLLPAAALVVIATLAAGFFVLAPVEQNSVAKTAITTSLYSSNIRFIHEKTDYLAADSNSDPLLHTWSLAVEEQFYLFWPLLILIGMRFLSGSKNRTRMYWLMSMVAVISFTASLILTRYAQPLAFFGSPTRAWEFALGGLACMWNSGSQASRSMKVLPWAGLLAILVASFWFTTETPFPGVAALLPVIGAVLLLPTGARQSSARLILEHPASQFLGRLSYSWYLWHWPVLVLAGMVWKLTLPGRMGFVLVSLALAWLTQILVENPVRFYPALLPRPGLSVALAGGLTLLSVAVCSSFYLKATHLERTNKQLKFTRAVADLPTVDQDGCNLGYSPTKSPACVFGDITSSKSVVLFGDSHASQWFPALERIALDNHWKLVSFTKSACPVPSLERLFDRKIGRLYDECAKWRANTIQQIVSLHPAAVIVSSYSAYYLKESSVSPAQWEAGLRSTLSQFAQGGSQVLVLHDPPSPSFDVPICLARAAWTNSGNPCFFEPDLSLNAAILHMEKSATKGLVNAQVADVSSTICAGDECDPSRNGMMLYRDQHHLTATYVLGLAPILEPKVARLMQNVN